MASIPSALNFALVRAHRRETRSSSLKASIPPAVKILLRVSHFDVWTGFSSTTWKATWQQSASRESSEGSPLQKTRIAHRFVRILPSLIRNTDGKPKNIYPELIRCGREYRVVVQLVEHGLGHQDLRSAQAGLACPWSRRRWLPGRWHDQRHWDALSS